MRLCASDAEKAGWIKQVTGMPLKIGIYRYWNYDPNGILWYFDSQFAAANAVNVDGMLKGMWFVSRWNVEYTCPIWELIDPNIFEEQPKKSQLPRPEDIVLPEEKVFALECNQIAFNKRLIRIELFIEKVKGA